MSAMVVGPTLLCDACDEPASAIHCLPYFRPGMDTQLACADHDPGGYWVPLDGGRGLWADFSSWERHLRSKSGPAWEQLQVTFAAAFRRRAPRPIRRVS